jgi:uncharacterized protein DUF1326
MADIPQWWMKGDWFDVCSCNIPCPCTFAQPPTNDHCDGVMAYQQAVPPGAQGPKGQLFRARWAPRVVDLGEQPSQLFGHVGQD